MKRIIDLRDIRSKSFDKIWIPGTNITDFVRELGYPSFRYSQRSMCWTMDEKDYIMFMLKYAD